MARRDPVDAAITAVEEETRTVTMASKEYALGTGRPCGFSLPADVTDLEVLQSIQLLIAFAAELKALQRTSAVPRLILPS